MNQKIRQEQILNQIKRHETVTTQELAKEFQVSIMTIRRDLQVLEKEGYIRLIHGGAVWNEEAVTEQTINYKKKIYAQEKQAIASYCRFLVHENQMIFIETGTTTQAVAEELTKINQLKIFTNSLLTLNTLAKFENNQFFAVPGAYRELSNGFVGSLANQFIEQFSFDLAFVGAEGIDLSNGISVPDMEDALTKKCVINNSKKVILVADHSKFGHSFSYKICDFESISCIITDVGLNQAIVKDYQKAGIPIIQVNK